MYCRKTVKCGFSDIFVYKKILSGGSFCAAIKVSVSLKNSWVYVFFFYPQQKSFFFFFYFCMYSTLIFDKSWFS